MRKTITLVAVLLFSLMQMSCNGGLDGKAKKTKLETEKDKFSYALGLDIGKKIMHAKDDLDVDVLAQGLADRMAGGTLLMEEKDAVPILKETFGRLQQKQQEMSQEKGKENIEKGKKYLEENGKKEGVVTTESGLQYKVIKEGTGTKPAATDKVKVHYAGTLIDGTEFDSSLKRGQPAEFPLNGVIKGWTEGIQLMAPGAKYIFYIPSELGYGANPRPGGPIGPNEVLIFEVELLEVLK